MDVIVRSIVSKRDFGVIFSAEPVDSDPKSCEIERFRVKVTTNRMIGFPLVGETWRVTGTFFDNATHGRELNATSASRCRPAGRLICEALAARVPGLGPERAARLWKAYGERLEEVMRDGDAVAMGAVIVPTKPMLGLQIAVAAIDAWRESLDELRFIGWMSELGIGDLGSIERIRTALGPDATRILTENPYCMVPILGWGVVDAMGVRILRQSGCEAPYLHPARLVGAVDAAMMAIVREGDTATESAVLHRRVRTILGLSPRDPAADEAMRLGARELAYVGERQPRAPGCALMEEALTRRFEAMLASEASPVAGSLTDAAATAFVLGRGIGGWLHPEQLEAVTKVLTTPVACLTGGAGTGKTHAVRAVCDAWEALGGNTVLCAVAGRAALRLSRATGRLARTVFRTLRDLDQTARGEVADRAEIDAATLVVVDESSMLDLGSAYRLVERMPVGARLLLAGDPKQLPPVGFGLVFHRLAADAKITAELSTIHRQTTASGIPAVAAAIRRRQTPDLPAFSGPGEGVSIVHVGKRSDIADAIDVVVSKLGGTPMIITPTREGEAGMHDLNLRAHRARCAEGAAELRGHLGQRFSVGEPVMHLRNDYRLGLFNGSMGEITAIDVDERSALICFDDRSETFVGQDLIHLTLAYAITCHRAQGSQAARVVVALYESRLLDPSWLYTAVTRAEKQVVVVGDANVMAEALRRDWASDRRRVGFTWPPPPAAPDWILPQSKAAR